MHELCHACLDFAQGNSEALKTLDDRRQIRSQLEEVDRWLYFQGGPLAVCETCALVCDAIGLTAENRSQEEGYAKDYSNRTDRPTVAGEPVDGDISSASLDDCQPSPEEASRRSAIRVVLILRAALWTAYMSMVADVSVFSREISETALFRFYKQIFLPTRRNATTESEGGISQTSLVVT